MTSMHLLLYSTFTMGLIGASVNRIHLMSTLLCIEGMLLILYIMMTLTTSTLHFTSTASSPIILLTLGACEASAGLTLLVITSQSHANDHLKNLNLLQC
uniref:NADH-ubiquinone oxidoreductase chain 4L n=2 Tax=Leiolepis TaxID=52195 RepID=A0A0A8J430_9SAUR|nr:NADH dehydrogenase subunit 4L [Leiolepis guttata]BAJ08146.1 NADH dehydrogenase subunit 4L [Leiolepis guttata]BAQ00129.1 NADH dehydrogenase subunit 4L [Leiolepis boehmei]